ncbi:MAG: GmrSD restriction endonuclease domain-containing protein [Nostoc sp.]
MDEKEKEQNALEFENKDEIVCDESEDEAPLDILPEERRVRTDKQDVPIETLHAWVKRGKLNLQPEFQRYYVWNKTKASRLIESLLLDIPIPTIYIAKENDNTSSVVDGQQRLTTICSFIDGKLPNGQDFKLSSLQVITELNRKSFKDLSQDLQDEILNYVIRIIVIEKGSHPDVKFEMFERLNLGAEKLTEQELRNCIYRGNYNDLLRELSKNKYLLKIIGSNEPHPRMKDRELILRFFAMWRNTHLRYTGSKKRFFNQEMEKHRHINEKGIAEMRQVFEKSIEISFTVFGDRAFRRFNLGGKKDNPNGSWENKLNVALWDTILYTFSYFEKSQIIPIADRIREEFLDVMTNDIKFVEYITSTTDKPEAVKYRAEAWRPRLDSLISENGKGSRTFSRKLKKELFDQDQTCKICEQHIHDIDDAEVDHIQHYWRGGKTIPENARLTHRYCNRSRGGRP